MEISPAEPKDTIDVPGIAVQPASPIPTPKVEEDVVAKIEQPVAPAPVEEPKTEDVGVPEPVEAEIPAPVEKIEAVEPLTLIPQVEEQVPASTETPAQVMDPNHFSLIRMPK